MNTVQCTEQDSPDLLDTADTSDALAQKASDIFIFRWMRDWLALQAEARMPCLPGGGGEAKCHDVLDPGMAEVGLTVN